MSLNKKQARLRRAGRGRVIIQRGSSNRLIAYRSGSHIYVQLQSPDRRVLASASTAEKEVRASMPKGSNCAAAEAIGRRIAEKAAAAGLPKKAVFDRNGYLYHGRIRALADGARAGGMEF